MGSAYTPGLKVSARTRIEKIRRLPLKGTVLVREGEKVSPDTVVARTELPGIVQTVKAAEQMGIEPGDLEEALLIKIGDPIAKGQVIARTKGLFGLFKSECRAPIDGTFDMVSEQTGHIGIRQPATPIEKDAYIQGTIQQVIPDEGVVVACEGALVQGIFGVGGERQGVIAMATRSAEEALTDAEIRPEHAGKIVVGGANVTLSGLRKAAEVGAVGIVVGGVIDQELIQYLREALKDPGYDIGVAITGQEPISFTLMVTEGFGTIHMAEHTYELLRSLEGKRASINGATQIRAGVIRPEVVVPLDGAAPAAAETHGESGQLLEGTPIRIIREPYFGLLGKVTGLPSELVQVDSETWVRVLRARLEDGRDVTVPRANVEIIEG